MIVLFVLLIGDGSNVPFSNANGVTTMRTTGSVETYTDLSLKREIDAGHLVGPHLDVTGPYLEGPGAFFIQAHEITSPEDAQKEATANTEDAGGGRVVRRSSSPSIVASRPSTDGRVPRL